MSLITLDFETYYTDKDLGFRTQTTEEYIRDPRFEVIGVSVQVNDGSPVWFSGERETTRKWLAQFNWKESLVLAHNTLFDGAILAWHFGIKPMALADTLCMARALHGVEVGGSLAKLATRYNVGIKGDEVVKAINKRRIDFTQEELALYGEYCRNDVDLTYKLFLLMIPSFPQEELKLIDMTLKMFTEPVLYVEQSTLGFGIEVPYKTSVTTGKQIPALAKKDEGFIALTENDDPFIQQLCAVRLGTKSTLEEKRIERFMDIGKRNKGALPIPLKYYGAHTGRWSGTDKVNFQNLPSRDPKKKALKKAIVPPDGYMVINSDSSQIEARVLAWLAGQEDVVKQFANGEDVYSIFASSVYGKTITKADSTERFVGKTCILGLGYGTGALKLQHTLATSQPVSVKLAEEECKRIVGVYRDNNSSIIALWREADRMLETMIDRKIKVKIVFGEYGCVHYDNDGIILPNGFRIRYPNLRRVTKDEKTQIVYDSRKGEVSIWGGAVVENVVQALARIVVGTQMCEINNKYRVALTVHDAAVVVADMDDVDDAIEFVTSVMSKAPDWAKGLPVACEAKVGVTYGDC
jgi:DNA polymerase I-like protein with 3'-5' exonuclease and polymerase domains